MFLLSFTVFFWNRKEGPTTAPYNVLTAIGDHLARGIEQLRPARTAAASFSDTTVDTSAADLRLGTSSTAHETPQKEIPFKIKKQRRPTNAQIRRSLTTDRLKMVLKMILFFFNF